MRPMLFLPFCLASLALAKPFPDNKPKPDAGYGNDECLTKDTVDTVIEGYKYLLTQPGEDPEQFNATAERLLADDFKVYSDSILTLAHRPVSPSITHTTQYSI